MRSAAQQARDRLAQIGAHRHMPVQSMQTYALHRPAGQEFWRENLTCEQVDCEQMAHGWVTRIDEADPELGQRQAHYIRKESGRRFTEERQPDGLTAFTFPAGQPCFSNGAHRAQLEREPLYVVRGGDYRGNPQQRRRVHTRGEFWVEDFAENQDAVNTVRKRG